MANLKDDLDQYLLLQSDQKKAFKMELKMPNLPTSGKISGMFRMKGSAEPEPANGWLRDAQDSCCPKLVGGIGVTLCFLVINQFPIPVTNPKDHRIYPVPWPGTLLPCRLFLLHSPARTEGSQVRSALYNGKCFLHPGVWFPIRIRCNDPADVLQRAFVGFYQLRGLSGGHSLLLNDPPEYSVDRVIRCRSDYRFILSGTRLRSRRIEWLEILRATV